MNAQEQQAYAACANRARALEAQLNSVRSQGRGQDVELIRQLQKRIGSANWANWQMSRWCYYDYIRYTAAGVNNLDFFAVPLGSTDPVSAAAKTLEQTNVTKTRSFGQVYFILQQIRTHIFILPKQRQHATILADTTAVLNQYKGLHRVIADFLNQGVLNITLGQKQYFDIPQPFRFCPPGFGVDVHNLAVAGTVANTFQNYYTAQSDEPQDIYNVTPPQMIEPEQNIQLSINFDNANSPVTTNVVTGVTPNVDIGVLLEGYIVRPVQ